MLRSLAAEPEHRRFHGPSPLRCVSKDEDSRARGSSPNRFRSFPSHDVKQPLSFPRRRLGARGLQLCFTHPERGVGGAPRNVRVLSGTPVGRIMTRYARRLARRLASHNAGRSPLGAPPWRFWAPGAALASPWAPAVLQRRALAFRPVQRAPRTQVVVPGGRGPEPPEASGYEPPPQDATPRSAFRIVSGDAPQ
jgi:hypothetical protein